MNLADELRERARSAEIARAVPFYRDLVALFSANYVERAVAELRADADAIKQSSFLYVVNFEPVPAGATPPSTLWLSLSSPPAPSKCAPECSDVSVLLRACTNSDVRALVERIARLLFDNSKGHEFRSKLFSAFIRRTFPSLATKHTGLTFIVSWWSPDPHEKQLDDAEVRELLARMQQAAAIEDKHGATPPSSSNS
jgi:hypothetical protein